MRLVDLDPQWLMKDGQRIGFTFRSPTKPEWRQSCFQNPPPRREQWDLFAAHQHGDGMVQGCNPDAHWSVVGGIENANFETMSVTPSLDGSAGGLWHGHITNGEIVGGL